MKKFIFCCYLFFSLRSFAQVNYLSEQAKTTSSSTAIDKKKNNSSSVAQKKNLSKSSADVQSEFTDDENEVTEKETEEDQAEDQVVDQAEQQAELQAEQQAEDETEAADIQSENNSENNEVITELDKEVNSANKPGNSANKPAQIQSNRLSDKDYQLNETPYFVKPKGPNKGGVLRVPHPSAAQGLIRIESDGIYQYKVPHGEKSKAVSFRFGTMTPPNIIAGTTTAVDSVESYETMYGINDLVSVSFDYEWQPFTSFGRVGLQLGSGFMSTTGKGVFVSDGTEAREKYTLYIIPLSANLIYRFEYKSKQLFVPYLKGGMTYFGLAEIRDDNKTPTFFGSPAAGGGGGLNISISRLNPKSTYILDRDYGIADMWLTVEAIALQGFNEEADFTSQSLQFGVTVDF